MPLTVRKMPGMLPALLIRLDRFFPHICFSGFPAAKLPSVNGFLFFRVPVCFSELYRFLAYDITVIVRESDIRHISVKRYRAADKKRKIVLAQT